MESYFSKLSTRKPAPTLLFSQCSKFFCSIHITCLADDVDSVLESVQSVDIRLKSAVIFSPLDPVSRKPPRGCVFHIQLLLNEPLFIDELPLTFHFSGCLPFRTTLSQIAEQASHPPGKLLKEFKEIIRGDNYRRMLDIGGRARSGVLYADHYRDKEVVVIDIVEDEGVDIVCDAHAMSQKLKAGSFDILFSTSVFEHLVMPWKVAIEMNRVMRVGAVGLIVTHQTVGMHDLPWDYYRFSDSAWKGLFNRQTGFEIMGTELGSLQYIIPHVYSERHRLVEKTAGYEYSAVLIRKTGETSLDWPLNATDVTSDMYPH